MFPSACTAAAHPRSRGEHVTFLPVTGSVNGSSPLTRGALALWRPTGASPGLIPAHAGSTESGRRCTKTPKAHPRSRGEHHAALVGDTRPQGSSPLTRGALLEVPKCAVKVGLIPVHAGSTTLVADFKSLDRAHPRSRGEHGLEGLIGIGQTGSSPLTRGALGVRWSI